VPVFSDFEVTVHPGYLKKLPDDLVAEMNDKQRELIVSTLTEQAARYKTTNVELTGAARLYRAASSD
jgi:hypothetical protein